MKRDRANNEILWNNQKNGFDEKYFIHFRIVRILCERGYTWLIRTLSSQDGDFDKKKWISAVN